MFVGGCAGTNTPAAMGVTCPSVHSRLPLREPRDRTEFGTFTSSFGIIHEDEGIFIDNGQGIIHVAEYFLSAGLSKVHGLQTHNHVDHRSGIQNNKLLFKKNYVSAIYAPEFPGCKTFQELYDLDFLVENWPVSPASFGIKHDIRGFEPGASIDVMLGVKTLSLVHNGGCVAYRIRLPDGDVVIATDAELSGDSKFAYAEFVSGARLLYADMQYSDAEYLGEKGIGGGPAMKRENWGHSTPQMLGAALTMCQKVPSIILLGHHDPARDDAGLRAFEKDVQAYLSGIPAEVRFAREGDAFEL